MSVVFLTKKHDAGGLPKIRVMEPAPPTCIEPSDAIEVVIDGSAKILLDSELSAMISLLRRQMSGARFYSDTSPLVRLRDLIFGD